MPSATEAKPQRFETPQGALGYTEWGTPGTGPSIVLQHATGFHGRCWDQIVARLPAEAHIIAPDFRGHGRSAKPESISNWDASAAQLLPLIRAKTRAPMLGVGHSQGGYAIAWLAAHAPEIMARAVLVDPTILPAEAYANPFFPPGTPVSEHPVSRRRNRWESAEAMATHFADRFPFSGWVRAVLDDYCRYGLLPAPDGDGLILACPPELEASAYLGSGLNNPHGWLSRIICPTRIVRGRSGERQGLMDFSSSPTWPGLAKAQPNPRDEQWHDCSHFVPMEQPDRLAALIAEEWRAAQGISPPLQGRG